LHRSATADCLSAAEKFVASFRVGSLHDFLNAIRRIDEDRGDFDCVGALLHLTCLSRGDVGITRTSTSGAAPAVSRCFRRRIHLRRWERLADREVKVHGPDIGLPRFRGQRVRAWNGGRAPRCCDSRLVAARVMRVVL
jgi:hypothetical protein